MTAERDALRAQVAALTPTDVQAKRSELGELAIKFLDACRNLDRAITTGTGANDLGEICNAASLAYWAARDAAKGAA